MTTVRRFLLLVTLMFWQGGFTFHGAVVIHVGRDVLGSHLQQGYITGAAANYLNLAGLAAIVLWAWDIGSSKDNGAARRRLRWALWLVLLLTLGLLAWLHVRLDELLDTNTFGILDRPHFYELHAWYLHISTVQWVASLILVLTTLVAWRAEDRGSTKLDRGDSSGVSTP